jgi:hypothetical protein
MRAHWITDRQRQPLLKKQKQWTLHADPVEYLKWPTYGFSQEYTKLTVTFFLKLNDKLWVCTCQN